MATFVNSIIDLHCLMIRVFEKIDVSKCTLCGSSGLLTGEHKIKASLLKQEFGNHHTMLAGKDDPKLAQSSKSKAFHFSTKICQTCNSVATQPADKAFHALHTCMKNLYHEGIELTDRSHRPNHSLSPKEEIDSFRYFAKIFCCFIAEVDGPRPKPIASFAIGKSDHNPIFLRISRDEEYKEKLISLGTEGFAQHGGLIFFFDENKRRVKSIGSSLAIGGITYNFWVQLNWQSRQELHYFFPKIVQTALANIDVKNVY